MTVEVKFDLRQINQTIDDYLDINSHEIAKQIARDARQMVPVDTGALKKSIMAKKSRFEGGGSIVRAGGKGARQAWLIEYGTKKMAKRAFLRPALDMNIEKAKQQFGVTDQ
jgi:HK97 gp10 family phage protein